MAKKTSRSICPLELPVLDTKSFEYAGQLAIDWATDKRYAESEIASFIARNRRQLSFLGVEATGTFNSAGKYVLSLTSSKYVGCVPYNSPRTGLPLGVISIVGRFGEDISELFSIIGDFVSPEYDETLQLQHASWATPPLYFECQDYIDKYMVAQKCKWSKFTNVMRIENLPRSSTQWTLYAAKQMYPEHTLKYPNRCNVISRIHPEWMELNYVLRLCFDEIESVHTPLRAKLAYRDKIQRLQLQPETQPTSKCTAVRPHMSDPVAIKTLKASANNILQHKSNFNFAWRIDYAEFFERYVQFLVKKVAASKGAKVTCNPKYPINGQHTAWTLKYIEPDIIVEKGDTQYVVDAKYKSHMLNVNGNSEQLKETFREDLHQIVSYTAFSRSTQKHALIIYPAKEKTQRELQIRSSRNNCACQVTLVGIPLTKQQMPEALELLGQLLHFDA